MKILISVRDFGQGGIPRCLQSLMEYIDITKYSVDIICLSKTGPYLNVIPNCNILDCGSIIRDLCFFTSKINTIPLNKRIRILFFKSMRTIIRRLLKRDIMTMLIDKKAKKLSGHYDCAIAYVEGDSARIISSMKCSNKLIWIHNDYDYTKSAGINTDFEKFNIICCVSEATRRSFAQAYPEFSNKTRTIYNIINYKHIIKQSEEPISEPLFQINKEFCIVSIGRICPQKHFDAIPAIAESLKNKKINFKWFIIGNGPDFHQLQKLINTYKVNQFVVCLGEQSNPYNFLAEANLFALTSRYESYPTVINEAKVLNIPIISTNIPSIYEMLKEKEAIIAPLSEWDKLIPKYLANRKEKVINQNINFDLYNLKIMSQFYKLVHNGSTI